MRLLVIGGTQFVGRAFVEAAVAGGHAVTVFHRGVREPDDLPDVEHVHGDRDGELDRLAGGEWDAALDTCAYFPRAVREAASVLGDSIGHYTLISSLSAHPEDLPPGSDEIAPTHEPPFPGTEEITFETYGPLKVACEHEAQALFAGRCLVIRPGYIVGPNDPTDRFTYWVRRTAGGGEMLAPGPPDAAFQVVDVRDLASFLLARMEVRDAAVYGVVGPGEPTTTRDALETARTVCGADTTLTWVDEDFLHGLGPDVGQWLPLWHPELPGIHAYDAGKAVGAGLRHRPFAETVADTLAWDTERGRPALRVGLPAAKERELLDAWHSRS